MAAKNIKTNSKHRGQNENRVQLLSALPGGQERSQEDNRCAHSDSLVYVKYMQCMSLLHAFFSTSSQLLSRHFSKKAIANALFPTLTGDNIGQAVPFYPSAISPFLHLHTPPIRDALRGRTRSPVSVEWTHHAGHVIYTAAFFASLAYFRAGDA